MSITKLDIVRLALRKAALASDAMLTQPDPNTYGDYLLDLELYVAELERNGIYLGYIFAPSGQPVDPNDDSGIQPGDVNAIGYNLAKRILIDNMRPVPDELATAADAAYDAMLMNQITVPSLKRRNDMPTGAGNKTLDPWGRFYHEKETINTTDGSPITP